MRTMLVHRQGTDGRLTSMMPPRYGAVSTAIAVVAMPSIDRGAGAATDAALNVPPQEAPVAGAVPPRFE